MTLSLYSMLRAWRRDLQAGKATTGKQAASPIYEVIACLGAGLAGISCGGDIASSRWR